MKIGGGLSYVVGPMGSGKSFYGVKKIVRKMLDGGYAVTNIELYPDWSERVAWHVARWSKKKRNDVRKRLDGSYIFEADLQEAMTYRLPGKGESRGVFVWDETHNDLSNRNWRDSGRGEILEWATQLRKLGFAGFLLSQHHENTDAQLRRVCNYLIKLQNQREQTRILGVRVTPWPLFLAVWLPAHVPIRNTAGQGVKPDRVERYFLNWQRHLYDTHGLYHGLSDATEQGAFKMLPVDPRLRLAEPIQPGTAVIGPWDDPRAGKAA